MSWHSGEELAVEAEMGVTLSWEPEPAERPRQFKDSLQGEKAGSEGMKKREREQLRGRQNQHVQR